MNRKPKALLLLYVLVGYVVTQFVWWAYLIYDLSVDILKLNAQLSGEETSLNDVKGKLYMILGEGSVFLILLFIGAYFVQKFVIRERKLARQERNFLLATTHEFNSPLASIRLNLQTLLKRSVNEEQRRTMLEGALQANQRLELLASNILTASRLDAGKYEVMESSIDVAWSLQALLKRFSPLVEEKHGVLRLSVSDDLGVLSMDKHSFELILGNLIENAIKYAPNGIITIKADRQKDVLTLAVEDQGPGIPEEERKNVLKKFYRSENEETRSQKGTGLGLYLVDQLCQLHQGKIQIEANEPTGARFLITFNSNK